MVSAFTVPAVIPAAVATAVIQLTEAPPNYLDIKIQATRGTEIIPETSTYYNVQVLPADTGSSDLTSLYQQIPATDTSLYLVVPPTPGASTVSLAIPPDGSAPPFQALLQAIESALNYDKITGVTSAADLINQTAWCTRIAYDIVLELSERPAASPGSHRVPVYQSAQPRRRRPRHDHLRQQQPCPAPPTP